MFCTRNPLSKFRALLFRKLYLSCPDCSGTRGVGRLLRSNLMQLEPALNALNYAKT